MTEKKKNARKTLISYINNKYKKTNPNAIIITKSNKMKNHDLIYDIFCTKLYNI